MSEPCLVDCQTLLTYILSDGKQAKVATKEIGDKVQVLIDGARAESDRVDCQTLLTSIHSDGKQARVAAKDIGDKVQCVDEKVQGVIDGARGHSQLSYPSNVNTFRQQASESSGTGNELSHSTGCQRHG